MMQKPPHRYLILCTILGVVVGIGILVYNENINFDYLSKTHFLENETHLISKILTKHLDKMLEEEIKLLRDKNNTLETCPDHPPNLIGPFSVEFIHNRSWNEVRRKISSPLQDGGRHKPGDCVSKHKVSGQKS